MVADVPANSGSRRADALAVIHDALPELPGPIEVCNQARVHLWFDSYFGSPIRPSRPRTRHVLKSARLTRASGATGAVTLIQRFSSALNLNIHFHMLVLDGAYLAGTAPPVFQASECKPSSGRRSCGLLVM